MIRPATSLDAEPIATIYNHYIDHSIITFEEQPVAAAEIGRRIETTTASHPWLVLEEAGHVVGYAYAAPLHARSAYRNSVETTVYLRRDKTGQAIGSRLYTALIEDLQRRGFRCAIGGIALPNDASVALHEKLGFRQVGQFEQVGFKLGRWIDVGYWQLLL